MKQLWKLFCKNMYISCYEQCNGIFFTTRFFANICNLYTALRYVMCFQNFITAYSYSLGYDSQAGRIVRQDFDASRMNHLRRKIRVKMVF
jgi:hypothetical protein